MNIALSYCYVLRIGHWFRNHNYSDFFIGVIHNLHDLEEDGKEVMFLLLKCAKIPRQFSSILVVGVYYPPGQPAEAKKDMLFFLTNAIDSILRDLPSIGLIVTGDYNHMNLNPLCSRFNLRKVVKAPTRGRNTLDQILKNMSDLYNDVKHPLPLGRSDH